MRKKGRKTIFPVVVRFASAIQCYECSSGSAQGDGDQTCNRYVGASCPYGLFGCVKVGIYSGGVDKMGNWLDERFSLVALMRGCNVLPFGGVDACQQHVLLGYRVVTCYCFSDFCNAASRPTTTGKASDIALKIAIAFTMTTFAATFFAFPFHR